MELLYDDNYFMKQALIEAQKAFEADEVPVGAVIAIDNKIIARAHNLTERLNDVTAHAEMQAITSAANYLNGKYLSGGTVYVTMEPCIMCIGAIYWARLSRIVFAAGDPKRGYQQANIKLYPKSTVSSGIMESEAVKLLNKFFDSKRK